MTEDVAGAVDAGTLAVPHGEHAVVFALATEFRLLRAPDRGRGQVLVNAALETDIVLAEKRGGALKLAVQSAKWRSAITGDVACGIEAVTPVQLLLHQAESHQRLEPGDKHMAVAEIVFIVELYVAKRHRP